MWSVKKFICFRYLHLISDFAKRRVLYLKSSQTLLYNMDESESTNMLATDTSNKITYAGVLSKGRSPTDDISNNNPNNVENTTTKENQSLPNSSVNSSNASGAMSEENRNKLMQSGADSLSDSFEDAEEDQSNFNTLSNETSFLTNGTLSKEETPSSLVTEMSSNSVGHQDSCTTVDDSESEIESDSDGEKPNNDDLYPTAMKWRFRSNQPITNLPKTVTLLETKHGCKVYVVGTAHFSVESQEDVAKTIKAVQPDTVVIELCKSRLNMLCLSEAVILEEAKTMNLQKIRQFIAEDGFVQGVLSLLLLSMSAHLTKQLGMAPGGEFRRACEEAKKIPGCLVQLGDRPIHITIQRALAKLSLWQKIRIGWHILLSRQPISKEEVERCKEKDLLEEMLAEMTGEYPELSHVFVKERDIYLTYSLQAAASPIISSHNPEVPSPNYVVGVVGIGHVSGIQENWGKVTDEDIPPLLQIPEPSKTSRFIHCGIRYSLYGLGVYGVYKLFPRSLIPTKLFSALKHSFGQ